MDESVAHAERANEGAPAPPPQLSRESRAGAHRSPSGSAASGTPQHRWKGLRRWFDSRADTGATQGSDGQRIDWGLIAPFLLIHLGCLGVFFVGWSPFAVGAAVLLYALRMVAITGFYHRYFSHRAFQTSRTAQFVFAVLGASAAQRGPLWWASHHRHHHRHSDQAADSHSPRERGFLWSHMGWFLVRANWQARWDRIPDLMKYPELRFIDRFDVLVPLLLAAGLYGLGMLLERAAPDLETNGPQLLVWGFFVSTVVLYHVTFTINSFAHRYGTRRFATRDDSRNNVWLALLTFGEGWHNNHHHYPGSARQGFRWWEIDVTYYVLRVLAAAGLIWNLKPVPAALRSN